MVRLSGMPKGILDDILARLPDKDAAKTIVLSKTWRHTWYSFPNISVDGEYFFTEDDIPVGNDQRFSKLDNLSDYVTKRLLRLRDQDLAIKKFKLSLFGSLKNPTLIYRHLDQWILMACETGVKVLELCVGANEGKWYDLPVCVIEAKSLVKLELGYGIRIGKEFLKHSMKLSSVKMLSLSRVLFAQEGDMEHFISLFPLTEHLTIYHGYLHNHLCTILRPMIVPLESLFLHGLQKLKEVDLQGIQEVHIDSPNLKNLRSEPFILLAPFKLNFDSCTTLRSLALFNLKSFDIVDKFFAELFSKHPFLESLKIYKCHVSDERINISSAQLKVLEIMFCPFLKEVNIDAPNLLSCYYAVDDKPPVISFMRSSNLLEVKVNTIVDFRYFYSMREFIWNIPQKILASLSLLLIGHFV
ncbi:hypothetical protein PIB30_084267 [Stylosanthes scabra]|nr:hypothetical protein [Stylosanthes scabra]